MKMPSETEWALLELLPAREINGRDLAKLYEKEMGKPISYGTLYTTMRRLKDAGWIESREDSENDRRARYFKMSAPGMRNQALVRQLRENPGGETEMGLPAVS